ncbi:MAG: glycerophosphodiester phosphodiesterase [Deltaproteobacteria bacterium]|nr:MAG: glycerophosphodiester phosphodiesterase [Deltaproteobacteria bacterium]
MFFRSVVEHSYFAPDQGNPLVIAHRGGAGLWPENTIYAFERSAEMGVDVLETEIYSTADSALVLMHDSTVDRTTDGTGSINDFTVQTLKELDAGYTWTPDGGETFPFRGRGISVPTLQEVFTAFPNMRINIDIKQVEPPLAVVLCDTIRTFGMADKVLVASFNWKAIGEFRRECPEVATSACVMEVSYFFLMNLLFLGSAHTPVYHALQVPEYRGGIHLLTKRFVDAAHRLNLRVHAWTINAVQDMQRLLSLGVDGIITDYPDRLISLLGGSRQ